MYKIIIIWWTDWFLKFLAKFILNDFREYVKLIITWVNKEKGELEAKNLGCDFLNDNKSAVIDADIVIFSVPISIIEKLIEEIAPHIKVWALVSDVCSVKWIVVKVFKKFCKPWVLIIPSHPMFGPFLASLAW